MLTFSKLHYLSAYRNNRQQLKRQHSIFSVLSFSLTLLETYFCCCKALRVASKTTQLNHGTRKEIRNVHVKLFPNLRPPFKLSKMDSPKNEDEPKDIKRLSMEELRRRRLAALGILQAQSITFSSTIESNSIKSSNNLQCAKHENEREVIDLLDSDSEGEVQLVNCSGAGISSKKRPPSYLKQSDSVSKEYDHTSMDAELLSSFRKHLENVGSELNESVESKASNKERVRRKRLRNNIESDSGDDEKLEIDKKIEIEIHGDDCRHEWKFKVATWNVWFGPQGDGQPHPGPRMRAIVRLLMEHNTADTPLLFIGLQEVINPLAQFLIPALESAGYCVYRQQGAQYGCAVVVHKRLEIISHSWIPYTNSAMMRGYYQVRAKLPNKLNPNYCPEVVFTTTHLESYTGPSYTGATERPKQLLEVENFCNEQTSSAINPASVAIITGDLNWDDEGTRRKLLDPVMSNVLSAKEQWHDSWLLKTSGRNAAVEGYTYDARINAMLGGSLRRRFDRCLVRSIKNNSSMMGSLVAQTMDTVLVGQDAIQDLTWDKKNYYNGSIKETQTVPSDHFGLIATVRLAKSGSVSSSVKRNRN